MGDVLSDVARPRGDSKAVNSPGIGPAKEPERERDRDPLVVVTPVGVVFKKVRIRLAVPGRKNDAVEKL